MPKTSVKFQNNWRTTVRGVATTRYPLSIHFDSISCKKKKDLSSQSRKSEKNNPDYGRCNNPFYFGADTRSAGCYFYDYAKNWYFNSNPKQEESFFSGNCQIVYLVRHWIRAAKRLQTHLESLRRLCSCAVPICATNMRNYLFPSRIGFLKDGQNYQKTIRIVWDS